VWYVVIVRIPLQKSESTTAKLDDPITCGYGIDDNDAARENQSVSKRSRELGRMPREGTISGTEEARENLSAQKKPGSCWPRSGVSRIVVNEPPNG
jgi:hypothetical protein